MNLDKNKMLREMVTALPSNTNC